MFFLPSTPPNLDYIILAILSRQHVKHNLHYHKCQLSMRHFAMHLYLVMWKRNRHDCIFGEWRCPCNVQTKPTVPVSIYHHYFQSVLLPFSNIISRYANLHSENIKFISPLFNLKPPFDKFPPNKL